MIRNYGFYAGPAPTPEWMHAERMEYCDNFTEENETRFDFRKLIRLFVK